MEEFLLEQSSERTVFLVAGKPIKSLNENCLSNNDSNNNNNDDDNNNNNNYNNNNDNNNNNNNNNKNSLFILGNNVQLNQLKITKIKLLHINKYIKPSYLGTDQYRVQAEKFHYLSSVLILLCRNGARQTHSRESLNIFLKVTD